MQLANALLDIYELFFKEQPECFIDSEGLGRWKGIRESKIRSLIGNALGAGTGLLMQLGGPFTKALVPLVSPVVNWIGSNLTPTSIIDKISEANGTPVISACCVNGEIVKP